MAKINTPVKDEIELQAVAILYSMTYEVKKCLQCMGYRGYTHTCHRARTGEVGWTNIQNLPERVEHVIHHRVLRQPIISVAIARYRTSRLLPAGNRDDVQGLVAAVERMANHIQLHQIILDLHYLGKTTLYFIALFLV